MGDDLTKETESRAGSAFLRLRFGAGGRMSAYRDLIAHLQGGAGLTDALEAMRREAGAASRTAAIEAWLAAVRGGQPFAAAVRGWVPEKDRRIIEAGEETGRLRLALENAVFIAEHERSVMRDLAEGFGARRAASFARMRTNETFCAFIKKTAGADKPGAGDGRGERD